MNHRILVVDDNAAIHEDIRKILAPAKADSPSLEDEEALLFGQAREASSATAFEIDSALQGQEGLELVRQSLAEQRPYALAFVDVRMPPGWDGVETISRIWEIYPELQVVICTAYSDYSWEDITRRFGHSDSVLILKKPFDNIEVLQMAHALTKKWFLTQQAKSQMLNLEERFARAFRASPVAMSIQSLENHRFLDVNDSYLEMTGYTRDELIGRSVWELNLWPDQQTRKIIFDQLANGKSVRNVETKVRAKDGLEKRTLLSADLTTLENTRYALISENDISQRLELESQLRQAQKMEAVGHLAAGVAHDFRNILTVIHGHASLRLTSPSLDEKTTESLKHIIQSVDRASNLTGQLLAFSRKQIIRLEVVDINRMLRHLSNMLSRIIGEHISLNYEFASNLPPCEVDVCSIEQVILNMAVNARDAMPKGGSLTMTTCGTQVSPAYARSHPEAAAGDFVCITVTDTGCGMDELTQSRLFEPFFTTKPPGQGTGLGLATCHGIVRQSGGHILVESEPGRGTTVRVYLPRAREDSRSDQDSGPSQVHPGPSA